MTPRELNEEIEVFTTKNKNEFKQQVTIAYYNAYFQRVKQMPKLEDVMSDIDRSYKKVMTEEEILKEIQKLHRMFGGV